MPSGKQILKTITRIVNDEEVQQVVRITIQVVSGAAKLHKFCTKCGIIKSHTKHEDDWKNGYHLCDTCDQHN